MMKKKYIKPELEFEVLFEDVMDDSPLLNLSKSWKNCEGGAKGNEFILEDTDFEDESGPFPPIFDDTFFD